MTVSASIAGLPDFLEYFCLGIVLLACFARIYMWVTPHDEFALLKANKASAAVAFVGSLLGFCLPLQAAIEHSVSIVDCLVWGLVALIVQVLAFLMMRVMLRDLSQRITNNEMAAGVFVAGISIGVGLLDAASMSY